MSSVLAFIKELIVSYGKNLIGKKIVEIELCCNRLL